ncbi:M56 family metallopeptidase [Nocardia africana]|uniref:M56 family metallopeptidase n=1 Tax=Nocardia africana TaxID=134964 RepID=UPI001D1409B1|nr:M56 family metallopeptidase [Nocardia africana]MCC3316771.1 M56 family metallopeptidase [Nocardia africana]
MSSAVCLLLYGFVVAVLAPSVLRRYTRDGIAPRLGLTAWLCAIVSVAVSWAAAIVVVVVDIAHDMSHPGETSILDSCLLQLHDAATGQYGAVIQVALLSLAAMAAVAGGFLLARLTAGLLRARSVTHDHARMARVIGRHNSRLDVFVIDLDEPMAYCVAGKPDTVVVTQGVVEALDDAHLQAVLAHERAHLAGRHHVLLALTSRTGRPVSTNPALPGRGRRSSPACGDVCRRRGRQIPRKPDRHLGSSRAVRCRRASRCARRRRDQVSPPGWNASPSTSARNDGGQRG